MHIASLLVTLLVSALGVLSQTTSGSWACIPSTGITDLPACDDLFSSWQICNGTATDQEYRQCLCKQAFVNNMVNCESQARLCYESDSYDSEFFTYLSNWHEVCDSYITFTPTSPVLSSLTTTFVLAAPSNQAYCNGIAADACQDLSLSAAACLQINTAATGSQYTSCICQAPVLSLASVCLYDAAITCFSQTTATLSDLPLYASCAMIYSSGTVISRAAGQQSQMPSTGAATQSATATVVSSTSASVLSSTPASNTLIATAATLSSHVTNPSTTISAISTNSQAPTISPSSTAFQGLALRTGNGRNSVVIGMILWPLRLLLIQ